MRFETLAFAAIAATASADAATDLAANKAACAAWKANVMALQNAIHVNYAWTVDGTDEDGEVIYKDFYGDTITSWEGRRT